MTRDPAESYVPMSLAAAMRRQALKVWAVGGIVAAVWVALIISVPLSAVAGMDASPMYKFFSYICHQQADRSFHIDGYQFAVCHRCFGIYFGLLAGFAAYPLWRSIGDTEPLPRFWLFLSMIPIGLDAVLGMLGYWNNTALTRFVTGTILGFACGTFIIPALVEIFRNLTAGRRADK